MYKLIMRWARFSFCKRSNIVLPYPSAPHEKDHASRCNITNISSE